MPAVLMQSWSSSSLPTPWPARYAAVPHEARRTICQLFPGFRAGGHAVQEQQQLAYILASQVWSSFSLSEDQSMSAQAQLPAEAAWYRVPRSKGSLSV